MYNKRFGVYPVSARRMKLSLHQYIYNITKNLLVFCAYR